MVIVDSVTASVPHGTELSQTMRTGRPPRDAARSTRQAPTAASSWALNHGSDEDGR